MDHNRVLHFSDYLLNVFFLLLTSLCKNMFTDWTGFAPPRMPIGMRPWLTFSQNSTSTTNQLQQTNIHYFIHNADEANRTEAMTGIGVKEKQNA